MGCNGHDWERDGGEIREEWSDIGEIEAFWKDGNEEGWRGM